MLHLLLLSLPQWLFPSSSCVPECVSEWRQVCWSQSRAPPAAPNPAINPTYIFSALPDHSLCSVSTTLPAILIYLSILLVARCLIPSLNLFLFFSTLPSGPCFLSLVSSRLLCSPDLDPPSPTLHPLDLPPVQL